MTEQKQQNLLVQLTYDKEIQRLKEENRDLRIKIDEEQYELRRTRHFANTIVNMKRLHVCHRVDTHLRAEERPPVDFIKRELALKLANTIVEQAPVQVRPDRHSVEYFINLDVSFCALEDGHARQRAETVRPVGPVSRRQDIVDSLRESPF